MGERREEGVTKHVSRSGNYRVNVVRFSVVREADASDPALISDSAAAYALLASIIPDDAREHFVTLLLDSQNRVVAVHEVSVGTLSSSLVHPREVFGPALRVMGVASVIVGHNHPSGDPTPSREDIRLTRQLVECGRLLEVPLRDHIVVGAGRFVSVMSMIDAS